jgi:hypothetical protein
MKSGRKKSALVARISGWMIGWSSALTGMT